MVTMTQALPHWDMTSVYVGLDSPEFKADYERLFQSLTTLVELFDRYGVQRGESRPLDATTVRAFDEVVTGLNRLLTDWRTIAVYISTFVATDSRNTQAQMLRSELQQRGQPLSELSTRFDAWIGSLDVDALLEQSAVARDHAFALRQAQVDAAHQMSQAEEALAAELNLTAGSAWGRLHGTITSQLMVSLDHDGVEQRLPMSAIRNLAHDADREIRRQAYEAELAAWRQVAEPLAAAFNSIKGQVNVLARRRGWDSPLDIALHNNHIDRQTLDAMLEAVQESLPHFRRYLRAKARALGIARLAWFDIGAPVGQSTRAWSFNEARAFIETHFNSYSPRMRDLAARAFDERWIDAEARPGKSDGGFCTSVRGEESRILVNYSSAFDGVSTLAHELGHAYHNLNLARCTPLQRDTPMALAETASIFCETIVTHAALGEATAAEQVALLEGSLEGICQVVVDIASRFRFENAVFKARLQHELSVDELNAAMVAAQQDTYGDGLDSSFLHPFMWAVKGHYYSSSSLYYNYPYTFGLLFGIGLYARYQQDPEGFRVIYDDLLASTGLADAATLAQRFGIDIRTPDFWHASIAVIRQDIDRFEELVEGRQ